MKKTFKLQLFLKKKNSTCYPTMRIWPSPYPTSIPCSSCLLISNYLVYLVITTYPCITSLAAYSIGAKCPRGKTKYRDKMISRWCNSWINSTILTCIVFRIYMCWKEKQWYCSQNFIVINKWLGCCDWCRECWFVALIWVILNAMMFWAIYTSCSIENKLVSVERIKQFTNIPSEATWRNKDRLPPANWPGHGNVDIKDLQVSRKNQIDYHYFLW